MIADDLRRLAPDRVQRLYYCYCEIIAAIEEIAGGPSAVGNSGEYWAAVTRRNACRQVFHELTGGEVYGKQ